MGDWDDATKAFLSSMANNPLAESWTYQQTIQEGFEKGIEKGREEGLQEGLEKGILNADRSSCLQPLDKQV